MSNGQKVVSHNPQVVSNGPKVVSAGHRFLRNPVHRSEAKMCRADGLLIKMVSVGHRFTGLKRFTP